MKAKETTVVGELLEADYDLGNAEVHLVILDPDSKQVEAFVELGMRAENLDEFKRGIGRIISVTGVMINPELLSARWIDMTRWAWVYATVDDPQKREIEAIINEIASAQMSLGAALERLDRAAETSEKAYKAIPAASRRGWNGYNLHEPTNDLQTTAAWLADLMDKADFQLIIDRMRHAIGGSTE